MRYIYSISVPVSVLEMQYFIRDKTMPDSYNLGSSASLKFLSLSRKYKESEVMGIKIGIKDSVTGEVSEFDVQNAVKLKDVLGITRGNIVIALYTFSDTQYKLYNFMQNYVGTLDFDDDVEPLKDGYIELNTNKSFVFEHEDYVSDTGLFCNVGSTNKVYSSSYSIMDFVFTDYKSYLNTYITVYSAMECMLKNETTSLSCMLNVEEKRLLVCVYGLTWYYKVYDVSSEFISWIMKQRLLYNK